VASIIPLPLRRLEVSGVGRRCQAVLIEIADTGLRGSTGAAAKLLISVWTTEAGTASGSAVAAEDHGLVCDS
jgi:hypothetical protein